jgi:UV DNA damage endonuclease
VRLRRLLSWPCLTRMRIGYPCINRSIGCQGNRTFRLKSYSEERLVETARNNLGCLLQMLTFNAEHHILFFRITSDLIPFASHPVSHVNWQDLFRNEFHDIGEFIKSHHMRISMHPDQFILLNSPDEGVTERSRKELIYHTQVLDLMELDRSAKIQIHVGGIYKDREGSLNRFMQRYRALDESVLRHLVIENDERNYSLRDCLRVHSETGVPVLLDIFHHRVLHQGESLSEAFQRFIATWPASDGLPMVDYSSQHPAKTRGSHAEAIDLEDFRTFLAETTQWDFDIMLEIKDKESSALKAVRAAWHDERFHKS